MTDFTDISFGVQYYFAQMRRVISGGYFFFGSARAAAIAREERCRRARYATPGEFVNRAVKLTAPPSRGAITR